MILTGSQIRKEVEKQRITIYPFNIDQVNPNSYNYRLGNMLIDVEKDKEILLPQEGFVIRPHTPYLSSTKESLGSDTYAMSLIGRSSMGRLGLFLQISADLGHTGSSHCWTLEIVATKPIRLYPNMQIGQISFWKNKGSTTEYTKGYSLHDKPTRSKIYDDINRE